MKRVNRAFTIVELLVVCAIISMLGAMLLPTLRKAQQASQQTMCAAHLSQIGPAIMMYVNDHKGRLPMVVEPLWNTNGSLNWDADPLDTARNPQSFANVMEPYLKNRKVLLCPSATLGYPSADPVVSYRISSANNYDGQIKTEEQLVMGNGVPLYNYSLKYLNGRKYRQLYVDPQTFPLRLQKGAGPFYLVRDFVNKDQSGAMHAPHNKTYNHLRLDLSVSMTKDQAFGLTYP